MVRNRDWFVIKKKFLRMIDANYNRAKESLRVGEDFSRFFLNDKQLTAQFKRYRHDLTEVLLHFPIPYRRLVASRNAGRDVGRSSRIQDGKGRPRWKDLMIASMKRSQEATRVLEEVSKVVAVERSKEFQRLRFRLYELEKRIFKKI